MKLDGSVGAIYRNINEIFSLNVVFGTSDLSISHILLIKNPVFALEYASAADAASKFYVSFGLHTVFNQGAKF